MIPLGADGLELAGCGLKLCADDLVTHLSPHLHRLDEPHLLQYREVFGDSLPRDGQVGGES